MPPLLARSFRPRACFVADCAGAGGRAARGASRFRRRDRVRRQRPPQGKAGAAGARASRTGGLQLPGGGAQGAIASAYPLASQAGQEILAARAATPSTRPWRCPRRWRWSNPAARAGRRRLLSAASSIRRLRDHARCAREGAGAAIPRHVLGQGGQSHPNASIDGPLAAGIPGEPAAFEYLARKYGKLPLKQSLQPAIRLAREGFPLYARLQGGIRYKRDRLLRSPDAAKVFLTPDGDVPELGAIIKQPDLANTLEAIANQGAKGFYEGRVARIWWTACARAAASGRCRISRRIASSSASR
jgi:gamma-glutamyltranspeptidase/glutathione hydrolase